MNAKLVKKLRKEIGNITGVNKDYRRHNVTGQLIVAPDSPHGVYKRVKKAKFTNQQLKNIRRVMVPKNTTTTASFTEAFPDIFKGD
jgi:hypothetical protein